MGKEVVMAGLYTSPDRTSAERRSYHPHPELWALVLALILLPLIAVLAPLSPTVCWIVLIWVVAALVIDLLFLPSAGR